MAHLGAAWLLAPPDDRAPAAGWEQVVEGHGATLYRNRYYRGWCWLERPEPAKYGVNYTWYDARQAQANCSVAAPNRLIFAFVRGPWLTASIGGTPVPLEDDGSGLCAVTVRPDCALVVLRYQHPRLREGLGSRWACRRPC